MSCKSVQIIDSAIMKVLELHCNILKGDISKEDLLKIMARKPIMQQLLKSVQIKLDLNMYQRRLDALDNHINAVNALLSIIDSKVEGCACIAYNI